MGAILDIVGSLALRGVILALVMNLILTLRDAEYERTSLATTTQNISTAARIIEKDLKGAGYNTNATAFLIATKDEVKFITDFDTTIANGGDTVDVFIAADPSGDANSKVIARRINGGLPLYIAKGTVTMNIQYYDSLGAATSNLSSILSLSVLLTQKTDFSANDSTKATIKKEVWVFPANL